MQFIYKLPGYILLLFGGFCLSWGGLIIRQFEEAGVWVFLLTQHRCLDFRDHLIGPGDRPLSYPVLSKARNVSGAHGGPSGNISYSHSSD